MRDLVVYLVIAIAYFMLFVFVTVVLVYAAFDE